MLRGGWRRAGGVRCVPPALGRDATDQGHYFKVQVCDRSHVYSRTTKYVSGGYSNRFLQLSQM